VATRKETPDEIKRTKQEWIESAAYLRAERFEVAGALFDVKDNQPVAESEVKRRLTKYKGGE
jgi:hypothetical protein